MSRFAISMIPATGRNLATTCSGLIPPQGATRELTKLTGVRTSEHGIVVERRFANEANVLLDMLFCQKFTQHLPDAILERLAIAKQLTRLGYSVAILHYPELTPSTLFVPVLEDLPIKIVPMYFKKLPPAGTAVTFIHPNHSWARDLWTKFGAKRIRFFNGLKGGYNDVGEGGNFVFIPGKKAAIAHQSLEKHPDIKALQGEGYRFYFVKDGEQFNPIASQWFGRKVFQTISHSDPFAGIVDGLMLVDYRFWRQNRSELRRAASDNGLEHLFIPEDEIEFLPANFLPLGHRKVMVNSEAPKTIELLRSRGIEVIPTCVPLTTNRRYSGGLHCIVNEL